MLDEALAQHPADLESWLNNAAASHAGAMPLLRKLLSAHGRVESRDILATLPKLERRQPGTDAGAVGMRLGPYELIQPIGRGGMGSVWLARHADGRLKREVAIKLPATTGEAGALATLRERFARERDFLAQLVHPHIARLYDAGVSEDGQPYLAMEYVAGLSITEHCDAGGLGVKARLALFLQVLDAVGHAHQHMVLHRDLKAGNVLVDAQGQVRLLDFGVARLLPGLEAGSSGPTADAPGDASDLTERAGAAFTLGHAAPEQVTHGGLSTATDVYALGVMLYHLLTGLSPYQPVRDTRGALEDAVLLATPAAASARGYTPEALVARRCTAAALRKALKGDLDVILGRALKKSPAERYPTVASLADDVRRHLAQQPISTRADGWWYRGRLFVARNLWTVAASSVAVLLLVATAGVAVWQANTSARNATLAAREAVRASAAQQFFARLLASADPEANLAVTAADRERVDQALAEAETAFAQDPAGLAIVLRQLGEIYDRLGVPAMHLQVQKKRVALLRNLPGAAADEVAEAHMSLGYALRLSPVTAERQQSLQASLDAQQMAVAMGTSPHLRVRSLCMIADIYRAQAQYQRADEFALQAVTLAESTLPRPHPELAMAYDQRGATAASLGQFDAARASFRQAMKVGEMPPARGKVAQLNSQINLANAEYAAGNYLGSRTEALSALAYARRSLGATEGTLTTLRVRATLASERAGELQEAKRMADTLFAGDLASGDPFRVARARYVSGVVALALGEHQAAMQAFVAAEPGLAHDPRWARKVPIELARLNLTVGQNTVAQVSMQNLLSSLRAGEGVHNEDFSVAAELLGVAAARAGEVDSARGLFDEACSWRRRTLQDSHPNRVRCEAYIALLANDLKPADKDVALDRQLQSLSKAAGEKSALFASIRRAQDWLREQAAAPSRPQNFPLLH